MANCPFHESSTSNEQDGEINHIVCSYCGEYRISNTALEQISRCAEPPSGWREVLEKHQLISTRDTSVLFA